MSVVCCAIELFTFEPRINMTFSQCYREPDFSLVRENSFVLARYEKDNLWRRGTVLTKNKHDTWMVKLESVGGGIIEVNLKDILPMDSAEGKF